MKPLAQRISERTVTNSDATECWAWLGGRSGKGVPVMYEAGKTVPVRRLLWQMHHGALPEGRATSTTCSNVGCVNPSHLEIILFKAGVEERFWSHVDKSAGPDACWPWKDAASFRNGYGMFRIGWKKPIAQASRLAYQLANNIVELQTENFIMHSCDNPPCCNPAHLTLGTAKENNADMIAKGRAAHQRYPEEQRARLAKGRATANANRKTGTDPT